MHLDLKKVLESIHDKKVLESIQVKDIDNSISDEEEELIYIMDDAAGRI